MYIQLVFQKSGKSPAEPYEQHRESANASHLGLLGDRRALHIVTIETTEAGNLVLSDILDVDITGLWLGISLVLLDD